MDKIEEEVEYDGGPPAGASSNDTKDTKDEDQEEGEEDRRQHHHRRDDDHQSHTLTNDKELRRAPMSPTNAAPGQNLPRQRRHPLQNNNNASPPYYEYDTDDRRVMGRAPHHPSSHNLHYQQLNEAQLHPYQSSWQSPDASSSSALSSVAGGFSLGIFSLAAWRWLNGGDFVLFPPPELMMNSKGGVKGNEDVDFASRLVQEEDEEEDDDEEEEVDADDDDEDEDDEEEEDDVDDAVRMILNGTCVKEQLPHSRQHTSQEHTELISEMRSLSSAIHSHREVLDRATRAAYTASGVGKGMTDDAMDFLKQKKKKKKEADDNNDGKKKNGGTTDSIDDVKNDRVDEKLIAVAALLKDVSIELLELKQSIINPPLSKKNQMGGEIEEDDGGFIGDVVNVEELRENEVEESCNGDKKDPIKMIDLVMEKILRILNVVEPTQLNGEDKHDKKVGAYVEVVDKEIVKEDASSQIEQDQAESIVSVVENVSVSPPSVEITQISEHQEIQPNDDGSDIKGDHDIIAIDREATIESTTSIDTSAPVLPLPAHSTVESESSHKNLEDSLRILATSNNANDLKVGAQMLYLYCRNIAKNPSVPRYRKLYTNNDNYRNKVGNLVGATEFLVAVGFIERPANNMFEWSSTDDDTDVDATRSKLDFALVALEMMKNGTVAGGMTGPNI